MKKLALTAWLLLLCACVPKTEPPTLKAEGLLAMSLPEMAAALHVGDVSSATLVAGYVNRIDAIDRAGPELRAVLSVNPLAMQEARNIAARALDQSRRQTSSRIYQTPQDMIDRIGGCKSIGSMNIAVM